MKQLRRLMGVALAVGFGLVGCGGGNGGPDGGGIVVDGARFDGRPVDGGEITRLRLATVNLRCLLDDWPARRALLVAQLAAADPDVIAFQEACRIEQGADNLAELLVALAPASGRTYRVARTETHWSWDQYYEGIALVSADELSQIEVVDLPPGVFPRRAVIGRTAGPLGPVLVAATHLSFGDDQSAVRVDQLAAIRAAVERLAPPDQLAVITGDCNEGPDGAAITGTVAAGYLDSWAESHPEAPGYTFPSSAPTTRIDYVLAAPGTSSAAIASAEVFLDQSDGTTMASDHLGLYVDFEKP